MMFSSTFVETTFGPAVQVGDCRLCWSYEGDRWGHRVQLRRDGEWSDLLVADPEGACVLQDLFLEQRADRSAEFQGMGQSAAGIHSASIVCDPGAGTITFDLATRFREMSHVAALGMAYLHGDIWGSEVFEGEVSGEGESDEVVIEPLVGPKVGTFSIEKPSRVERRTRIEWVPPSGEVLSGGRTGAGLTVQWGYRIRVPTRG